LTTSFPVAEWSQVVVRDDSETGLGCTARWVADRRPSAGVGQASNHRSFGSSDRADRLLAAGPLAGRKPNAPAGQLSDVRHRRSQLHPFEPEAANLFFQVVSSGYEGAA